MSKYRFVDPNNGFPQFYSFVPDEDDDKHPNELHYVVFGQNGPVRELRVYPDGTYSMFEQSMYDIWMEDKAVGLEPVGWEKSAWSDYYFWPLRGETAEEQ